MSTNGYLSAAEAAAELGISLPTLYAYVSRGLLRSEAADPGQRTRRYHAVEVQRLKEQRELRHDPEKVVDTALHWGTPVLESALTLIEGGRGYYRGRDITALAVSDTVEQTAALLWLGKIEQAALLFPIEIVALPARCLAACSLVTDLPPIERLQALLPLAAAEDLAAYDLRLPAVARTGARILHLMTAILADNSAFPPGRAIADVLEIGLREQGSRVKPQCPTSDARCPLPLISDKAVSSLISAALILCADHELNISSFTARCVASAGATPYSAVIAGLAALQGVKHGGSCGQVEALFRETAAPEQARQVLADRLKRGEATPGFGHRLYPQGDPRGRLLLERIAETYPESPAVELASALAQEAQQALGDKPNIDFALVTLCCALGLPSGTAIALFALGRTIGWIGHAIEAYQLDRLIRPRARYMGEPPHFCDEAEAAIQDQLAQTTIAQALELVGEFDRIRDGLKQ